MNNIDALIAQLCPDGVGFRELGEICDISTGQKPIENILQEVGKFHFVNAGLEPSGYINVKNTTAETITIPSRGQGGAGYVGYQQKDFWCGPLCYKINSKQIYVSTKFIYYYLKSIQGNIIELRQTGSIPAINKKELIEVKIPIPPLNIQQEIVNFLDKLTQLEVELQTELQARRTQYEYYRNELLNFEGKEVEWKTLGEIGVFMRGNGLQKKDFTESGVGCIHYGQIYTYYGTCANKTKSFVSPEIAKKLKKAQKGDLIIATTSENVEDVCKTVVWLGEDEIAISGETYIFKHNENAKYLAYYLQTPMFFNYKKQHITGTKVIRVSGDKLAKFKIPIPPLAEQERIVAILDKFDALVNDISMGLPAEIEARRKQYEYYRGKLLDFKPLEQ